MKSIFNITHIIFLLLIISNSLFAKANKWRYDTLTVGIKLAPPFIIKNRFGEYSGVSIDLWKEIAKEMEIAYRFKLYGSMEMDKMLEDVSNNLIDISISPITVTAERIKHVDFTYPFFKSQLSVAVPIKDTDSTSDYILVFFIKLFSMRNIYIMILIILFTSIFGISIWMIERRVNPKEFRKGIRGIGDGIWWAATIMSSIGPATKAPRTFFGRFIGIIWMFVAIITISLFIGSIASYLTAGKINSDINSVTDLKKRIIGTMKGVNSNMFLKKNSVPIAKNDFDKVENGLYALVNNEIQAFVYDEPIMQYLIVKEQINDKIYIVPLKLSTDYYSFALPKNSVKTSEINEIIVNELENITWKAILNKYSLAD